MELETTAHEVGFCTRDELKDAVHSLELKIESVRNDLSIKIEREIGNLKGQLMMFVISCLLAQSALMAGVLYFSLTHLRP
jgi:hypothetical protein